MAIWVKPSGLEIEINDRDESIIKAVELGWVLKRNNGDKGSGVPGSSEWHERAILGMSSKDEIKDYCNDLNVPVDFRGGIDIVKSKAIEAIISNDNGE
jgi:hypothetical protein